MTGIKLTPQVENVLRFYGGPSSQSLLAGASQASTPTRQLPPAARPTQKPYSGVATTTPTLSPYLNLYRDEEDDVLTNYFFVVRPQLDQIEANRRQQAEIQRLQREVQNVTSPTARSQANDSQATGRTSRYLDTGRYYGNWDR